MCLFCLYHWNYTNGQYAMCQVVVSITVLCQHQIHLFLSVSVCISLLLLLLFFFFGIRLNSLFYWIAIPLCSLWILIIIYSLCSVLQHSIKSLPIPTNWDVCNCLQHDCFQLYAINLLLLDICLILRKLLQFCHILKQFTLYSNLRWKKKTRGMIGTGRLARYYKFHCFFEFKFNFIRLLSTSKIILPLFFILLCTKWYDILFQISKYLYIANQRFSLLLVFFLCSFWCCLIKARLTEAFHP